ncbi:MAG: SurA N-terminal domain-containing protein [Pseudomonadota bacterium]
MFEFIRTHKRLMQLLLLLLILPSFVLVGVSSYKNGDTGSAVANVDGLKVTQQDWDAALRKQIDSLRQRMGAQFDQKIMDTPEAKQAVLENLVAERALAAEIGHNHLTITDAMLGELYAERFKGNLDEYKGIAQAMGLTTQGLDQLVRKDMAMQQLSGAIQASAFAPRSVATRLSDINDQEREVQELLFPAAQFMAEVKVSDAMVKAFYDKNAAFFQIPEQVKAEYVVFNADVVESQVSVSDAEVAAAYAANQKRYTAPEQRSASHILLKAKKDGTPAEKAGALAKAKEILAEVRKSPAEFAKIAKAKSEDAASAEQGGDLGQIGARGALPPALDDAVFGLKQGEISDIVSTEYGFHIVMVNKVVPATIKPLDEVKGEIAAELKKGKMSKKYSELAEQFTNTVDEQSDSLKPVADKLKLKIETVASLSRTPAPGNTAVFANPKFLKAIFADESLKNKRNTEAVEVAPSTLIAGRVVEYKPASKRALAEVEPLIRQRVTIEEAAKLAKKAGEARLAAAKASGDGAGFGDAKVITRMKQPEINPSAAQEVMKADVSKLPAYVGVELPGQGYGIYRISKVGQPATQDAARRATEAEQIGGAIAQQEMHDYVEALKQKAKAKIFVKAETVTVEPVAK